MRTPRTGKIEAPRMPLLGLPLVLLMSILGATPAGPLTEHRPRAGFQVHTHHMAAGAFVNAFVVETAERAVVIDTGFSPRDGEAILELAQATGKPIEAVLLTHGHLDHYGGSMRFRKAGIPILAGSGVDRHIEELDAVNYARFGVEAPAGHRGPDRTLGNGATLAVDGVDFVVHTTGPGEALADSWWSVSDGERTAVFVGDLVMFGIPPFAQSGRTAEWLATLRRLRELVPADARLYLGHDVGAGEDPMPVRRPDVIDWQIARLEELRATIAELTSSERLLTEAEIEAVVDEVMAHDAYVPGFGFIVSTAANVVAAELIAEREAARLEERLQAIFAERR